MALKDLVTQRDLAFNQFPKLIWAFEGETKDPIEAIARYSKLEAKLIKLQVAQAAYNLKVTAQCRPPCTLHEAVKLIGVIGRLERMWRRTVKKEEGPRWARSADLTTERDKDKIYAVRTVSEEKALDFALIYSRSGNEIRAAIQEANATKMNLELIGLTEDDLR